jgi:hypothetical protein
MVWPAIRLHQLYSINFYDGLDVIFEDLSMINLDALKEVVSEKSSSNITIINRVLKVNTVDKTISIIGHMINNSTYIVKKDCTGDIMWIKYKCSDEDIFIAIEYLYHMGKTLHSK